MSTIIFPREPFLEVRLGSAWYCLAKGTSPLFNGRWPFANPSILCRWRFLRSLRTGALEVLAQTWRFMVQLGTYVDICADLFNMGLELSDSGVK